MANKPSAPCPGAPSQPTASAQDASGLCTLLRQARRLAGFDVLGLLRSDGADAMDGRWRLLAQGEDEPLWSGLQVQHARFPWLAARLVRGEAGRWTLARLPAEAEPDFWRGAGLSTLAVAPVPGHPGHGLLAATRQAWRPALGAALELLALAVDQGLRAEDWRGRVLKTGAELQSLRAQLEALDPCDALTGVYSRAHLEPLLSQECGRAQREALPISLILADVDGFSEYNRLHSRDLGDYCLQQVAAALAEAFERAGETVARFDGDCFAVLLPLVAPERAEAAARRLLGALRARRLPHGGGKPFLTASLGLATLKPDAGLNPEALIDCAARALHEAQAKGGDRLCEWCSPPEP
ncbi:MAG: GGDEF domain-containing protein [Gammaproteobacteria bacterium]|nr:GGDEF domain-containing protein [Gammaproteobacteria bacterium]